MKGAHCKHLILSKRTIGKVWLEYGKAWLEYGRGMIGVSSECGRSMAGVWLRYNMLSLSKRSKAVSVACTKWAAKLRMHCQGGYT